MRPSCGRRSAFGDVELGHDLDAADDGVGQVPRRGDHFVEDAVGADADLEFVFERLEVDIAGLVFDGQEHDHVEELADGGIVGLLFLGAEVVGAGHGVVGFRPLIEAAQH